MVRTSNSLGMRHNINTCFHYENKRFHFLLMGLHWGRCHQKEIWWQNSTETNWESCLTLRKWVHHLKSVFFYWTHTDQISYNGHTDPFIQKLYSERLNSINLEDHQTLMPTICNTIVLYEQKITMWTWIH